MRQAISEKYRCNQEMVELEEVGEPRDVADLRAMLENHFKYTKSTVARRVPGPLGRTALEVHQGDADRLQARPRHCSHKPQADAAAKKETVFVNNNDILERI